MNKEIVRVDLGKRSYDIIIGSNIISDLALYLRQIDRHSKIIIVTDENISKLYLPKLLDSLKKINIGYESIILESGEQMKSFPNLQNLCEKILKIGIDRKALLIAFGGGVIGDLCGFAASILLRGINFVQIPTTLLAAVDSSVGGKTAINSIHGKNLIGSFYQPKLVFCEIDFLSSLSEREFLSGYAECLKYGLIKDYDFFLFLDKNLEKIKKRDNEILQKIILRSCQIKAEIIAKDERENDCRALLNFGHSFAHIFETETNYSIELLHGEAVAIGMILAAQMSVTLGMLKDGELKKIVNHIEKIGLKTSPFQIRKKWKIDNLLTHLYKDKKNSNGQLTFILLEKIGAARSAKNISEELFKSMINSTNY